MSLESYLKTVKNQRERDVKKSQTVPETAQSEEDLSKSEKAESSKKQYIGYLDPNAYKTSNSKIGKIFLRVILIAFLVLAALSNPSKSEAKADIKMMVMEKITEKLQQQETSKGEEEESGLASGFAMIFAPMILNNMVQIDVSNYIFFSTFETRMVMDGDKKTLITGCIFFGKIIPLKSYIKD